MARRTSTQTSSTRRRSRSARGEVVLLSRTVLCTIGGISERQLELWEHEDLLAPAQVVETAGNREPLYDRAALHRVRVIRTLAEELEVNLPGIGVILHLLDQLQR